MMEKKKNMNIFLNFLLREKTENAKLNNKNK